jgi:hypothetical protein
MATGMAGRRSEAARGDAAGIVSGLVEKLGAAAHRLAAFWLQADALLAPGRPGDDPSQGIGADEVAGCAHRLGDRPHQPGEMADR